MFATHVEAKSAGYFSRRHRTSEAHTAAREHYQNRRVERVQHPRPEEWPPRGVDYRKFKPSRRK